MSDKDKSKPYISAHFKYPKDKTAIEIDMIFVPKEMRGSGVGTRLYEAWEAKLPASVHAVHLFAANTEGEGSGDEENSDDFWWSLGFKYRYRTKRLADSDYLPYEERHTMIKGVNGHSTPKPIVIATERKPRGPF